MNDSEPNTNKLPFPPALMAIDFAALIAIGICVAELSPKSGRPLGLIPENFVWPLLIVAIAVAAICAFLQVRILLKRKNTLANAERSKS